MNFLAHLYLSGNEPKLMLGNFIADFVKGKQALSAFEPGIRSGILLHRSIDAFTDSHPVVAQSKDRLRAKYRHYAGVIVDVFYDHLLAVRWSDFHPVPLSDFATSAYRLVQDHEDILPERVQEFFPYMVRGNWLVNYASRDGIARTLSGMSRRTPYDSKMNESVDDLFEHRAKFENEFLDFFPELVAHAATFRLQLRGADHGEL